MKALNIDWRDNPRLDLADRHEIDALRTALNCRRTDLYDAVAMVGDSVRDIRRHVEKMLDQRQYARDDIVIGDLPPVWTSLEARSG